MAAKHVDKMTITYILNPTPPSVPSPRSLWPCMHTYDSFGRLGYPRAQEVLQTSFQERTEVVRSNNATPGEPVNGGRAEISLLGLGVVARLNFAGRVSGVLRWWQPGIILIP